MITRPGSSSQPPPVSSSPISTAEPTLQGGSTARPALHDESTTTTITPPISLPITIPAGAAAASEDLLTVFRTLSLETDINQAPENWLRGDDDERVKESCYWSVTDAPELSAVRMAAMHPRELLSADVISDSRNVKKLLKMDQDKEEVSMAVHRIGKTLLLDEFPIDRYIPQRQEKMSKKRRKRNKAHVNTISKFLYHTILQNNIIDPLPTDIVARKNSLSSADIIVGMGDPLSRISLELPQILNPKLYPPIDYNRTMFWDFEDIHMLLGNNMPIFGGGEYPAISLKLRDMKEPINVLTGIDCWLDNLICNVPELAMCWHLDGFVQGYELFKTEEIPNLTGCKFDPIVIKDLASNMLKFLQARCVKEGHTYWLYRAKGDDIVKLYDLSSICSGINLREMNPFSTPVAMLCFKVAQRLFEDKRPEDRSTVFTLLQNCLNLIPTNEYPQMEATAHFIISDIFLSSRFEVSKEHKIKLIVQPLYECHFENLPNVFECSMSRDLLNETYEPPQQQFYWRNIACDLEHQLRGALKHVVSALELVSPEQEGWAVKLQKLLLFKASVIFLHQSCTAKGAAVLSYALLSLVTIDAYNALLYYRDIRYDHGYGYEILRCLVLCQVSDILLSEIITNQRGKSANSALTTFDNILRSLNSHARSFDLNCTKIFEWCYVTVPDASLSKRLFSGKMETREEGLLICLEMYIEVSSHKKDMSERKLGFVYNELASYNLGLIKLEDNIQEDVAKQLLKQSFDHYKCALAHFKGCTDIHNMALVNSNMGKVMRLSGRLQARFHYGRESRGELLYEEKELYKEAINYYNVALDTLRKPSVQKEIWCVVSNELSGVYFSMATIMQDYPSGDEDQSGAIRELTNFYNKSLRISEGLVRDGFSAATGRTGGIHQKLASLYHQQARDVCGEGGVVSTNKRRRLFTLAGSNYEKAASYFRDQGYEVEQVQGVMEHVGLLHHLSPTPRSSLTTCLDLLSSLHTPISSIYDSYPQQDTKMLYLLKDQILAVLKTVVLLQKQGKVLEGFGSEDGLRSGKDIFGAALRRFQGIGQLKDTIKIVESVLDVLKSLSNPKIEDVTII